MNLKFSGLIASVALVALSSCSSMYKSGQTPDDVYYSPGRPAVAAGNKNEEYVETNRKQHYQGRNNPYYDEYNYRDDRYLQMMVTTGRRPYYDDFYYMDPYLANNWRFNSYMAWSSPMYSPWNPMFMWNSFYNPYSFNTGWYGGYPGGVLVKPVTTTFNHPSRPVSAFSMSSYLNTNSNNKTNNKPYRGYSSYYNNSNINNGYGESRRSSYSGDTRSKESSYSERPSRSYTPSSSSGSSGGGSRSGGGGGVSRPVRSGN